LFARCFLGVFRKATGSSYGSVNVTFVKVAIVAESFLPRINGVTNSVCRVLDHLAARGHEAMVIAPAPGPDHYAGFPVHVVPGFTIPVYRSFVVGLPSRQVEAALRDFQPDVVHLASPLVLGSCGAAAAQRLGIPSVAVFQTDIAGFFRRYGFRGTDPILWSWLRRLHNRADLTLAPSLPTLRELEAQGFARLGLWARGVDQQRFHPRHRSEDLRAGLGPAGETLIGYVGRLAAEKQVSLLGRLVGIPGSRLVVVGDGPEKERLRGLLPDAAFMGFRTGHDLSELVASLDVFVHTGANETFCQAVQEGLASGVPVVAPAAGGPLDLVRPGVNGLLFTPSDGTALRAAVSTLVADPVMRTRMSESAFRSVRGRTWDTVCDELLGHYAQVMYGSTARRAA
jgi:phosphatidylinositol alpha 1,6-mannosyltransferase